MATVLGASAALAAAWFLDPASHVRERLPPPPEVAPTPPPPESAPADAAETIHLLEQITSMLRSAAAGLTLSELRARLTESSEGLQRALAAGLRAKQLRRLGSHNRLRYVLNA